MFPRLLLKGRVLLDAINPYRDGSAQQMRTGRIIVGFTFLIGTTAFPYTLLFATLGLTVAAFGAATAIVTMAFSLWRFKRSGDLQRAANTLGAAVIVAVVVVSWATGGPTSAATPWFLVAPMLVSLFAGRRVGARWLVLVGLALAAMHGVEAAGLRPVAVPLELGPALETTFHGGLVLFSFAIAATFDAANEEANDRLQDSHRNTVAAHDEAERARADAQAILDNVKEGLVLLDASGKLQPAYSAPLREHFGAPATGTNIWEYLSSHDQNVADLTEFGWEQINAGWFDVAIQQLPTRLETGDRIFELTWSRAGDGQVLFVASDITERVRAEGDRAEHEEFLAIVSHLTKSRGAVLEFAADTRRIVDALRARDGTSDQERRWLHTLKGNSGLMGLNRFSQWIHELETRMHDDARPGTTEERATLDEMWTRIEDRLFAIVDPTDENAVRVSVDELDRTLQLVLGGAPRNRLAARIESWGWDDAESRLAHLAEQARRLGERMDKPVDVLFDGRGVRTPPTRPWRAMWSALVHMVRNAIDHGIESDRAAVGKDRPGLLELYTSGTENEVRIEIRDDGAGIDWNALEARWGQPMNTPAERLECLFSDGATTRLEATEVSGRGVGTSAVLESVEALGGSISVETEAGAFTAFTLVIPLARTRLRRSSPLASTG